MDEVRARRHEHNHGSLFSALWDRLGIAASALCLVDCLVLPIASTVLMGLGATQPWLDSMHWMLLPLIGLTAGMAFYHSFQAHRSYAIVAFGFGGFLLLVGGEIFEKQVQLVGINVLSILGSLFLIGAHVRNLVIHVNQRHACCAGHGPNAPHFGDNRRGNVIPVRVAVKLPPSAHEHATHVP